MDIGQHREKARPRSTYWRVSTTTSGNVAGESAMIGHTVSSHTSGPVSQNLSEPLIDTRGLWVRLLVWTSVMGLDEPAWA